MDPLSLGKQNSAVVLETLQVMNRPATVGEVSKRVSDLYKIPMDRIQPLVRDLLALGEIHGFFIRRNQWYSINEVVISDLRKEINSYVEHILKENVSAPAIGKSTCSSQSPLMMRLGLMDQHILSPRFRNIYSLACDGAHAASEVL
ncbi:uncharacterized protein LOC115625090 [Scaptodrosophila lebanonensis]|uniref:Uncharacterized protein LOC115625090 n=1 Tax=Drosophila lebanonensis TaxID=7225 RepID=A0A6J2TIL1_DROLE|nr:uncharacterized protein LOC115625090 [Scaptodrosophila lebanonensis]